MINLQAIVTLETGDKAEHIYIYEGDDIEILAEFFCDKHDLLPEGKEFIIREIQNTLIEATQGKPKHVNNPSMTSINSQAMIKKLYRNKTENDVFGYLHQEAWNQDQRRQQAVEDKRKDDGKKIKEKPVINARSRQLAIQRSRSQQSVFEKLYGGEKEAAQQKLSKAQQIFAQNHPFQPKIEQSKWQVRQTRQDQIKLADRLIREKSASTQRVEAERHRSQSPIDKKTGQEFFKPKINKNNRYFQKVSKRVDAEDKFLARLMDQKKGKIERERKAIFTEKRSPRGKDNKKMRSLFEQLDSDKDGWISPEQINLKVDERQIQRIYPVLCHMWEQQLMLDLQAFCQLIESFDIQLW